MDGSCVTGWIFTHFQRERERDIFGFNKVQTWTVLMKTVTFKLCSRVLGGSRYPKKGSPTLHIDIEFWPSEYHSRNKLHVVLSYSSLPCNSVENMRLNGNINGNTVFMGKITCTIEAISDKALEKIRCFSSWLNASLRCCAFLILYKHKWCIFMTSCC